MKHQVIIEIIYKLYCCGIICTIYNLDQWNIQQFEEHLFASTSAPPLPPRNTSRTITADYETYSKVDTLKEKNVDRLKIPTKLYENVIEDRTYDGELVAFFNMVCQKSSCSEKNINFNLKTLIFLSYHR